MAGIKLHKVGSLFFKNPRIGFTKCSGCVCSVVSDYDPLDWSLPGFSVCGIFQARILEWVAISFSGDLPDRRTEPGSPALQADSLPTEPSGCGGLRGRG